MLPVCASKLLAVSGHDIRNMRMKRSASYFSLFSLGYHQESIEHITENRGNLIFRSCLLVQGHSQNATPSHIHRPETLKSGSPLRTCSDVFFFRGFRSNTCWFHMVSCFMYAERATQLLSRAPRGSKDPGPVTNVSACNWKSWAGAWHFAQLQCPTSLGNWCRTKDL